MSHEQLGCPRCHLALELDIESESAECKACGNRYAIEEGVLCTDRTDVFMGEFDAAQMRQFVQAARAQGWRQTAQTMANEDSAARTVLLNPTRASFIGLLQPSATGSVLDIGAGMGAISLQLAKNFNQVYALDLAFERLAFLSVVAEQEGMDQIHTICHRDVFNLPFQTGVLDAAVMVGVFEYFPLSYPESSIKEVQSRALSELYRVISPGGTLFIATKNRFGWPFWAGAVDNSGLRFGSLVPRRMADMASRALLHRPYRTITDSYHGYSSLLREAGFSDIRFYWPVDGYQTSQVWVDLTDDQAIRAEVERYSAGGPKSKILSMLANTRALKHIVPHFGISAKKAD